MAWRLIMIHFGSVAYILLLMTPDTLQAERQTAIEQVRPLVVSITSKNQAGSPIQTGIGVVVNAGGDVVVHKRLVEGAGRIEAETSDGKTYVLSRVVAIDSRSELALLSGADPPINTEGSKVGKGAPGSQSQIVAATVEGDSKTPTFVTGTVKGKKRFSLWDNFEVEGNLPENSLGSPVFNTKGEFVGIIAFRGDGSTFTVRGGPHLPTVVSELIAAKPKAELRQQQDDLKFGEDVMRIGAVLQGRAIKRATPFYPSFAKQYGIRGTAIVQVTVDEQGNVVAAEVFSAHFQRPRNVSEAIAKIAAEDLKDAAVTAARKWKFSPTKTGEIPIKVIGTITFNFTY
jgi:TonB family protein